MQEEREQRVSWRWRDATIDLGLSIRGQGPTVVMLPALSSISTRREMAPLQQRLASRFRTVAIDWPGFGDLPRPALDWTPQAYAEYLAFVLGVLAPKPHAVVAAGHAAGYALGACLSIRRILLAKEVRVGFFWPHEQDIPCVEDR